MAFLDLLLIASMPVLKVLLVTALGLCLALESVDIMGESTRKQMNRVVFFVFNPALVGSNLGGTVTSENIVQLWFMPINILITFIIGSALGWILLKVTRAPQHVKGLLLGCCTAGNLGHLPLIIIPAVCKEQGSPFGAPDVCHKYGMAYASLSMAIGAVYLWSYVFNIVRMYASKITREEETIDESVKDTESTTDTKKLIQECPEALVPSTKCSSMDDLDELTLPLVKPEAKSQVSTWGKLKQCLTKISKKINLQTLLTPSTIGAIVGFIVGVVPHIRGLLIGTGAPLRVIEDSASLLGDAAIPAVTLIMGGNLLRGIKGSGIQPSLIAGVVVVRYILLPLFGIVIVKGALYFGLVHEDPLYLFILLLQYALPPAMNIGTMTQLVGVGESECSVVMLWTYALASVALTVWSTFFMWLVA
ncbi:protein PIN-LIKES 3-like isoform X2 [Syzygium oleosum]|nr:protein PIN-LIKES 3-like isoform X2 [Syzygium oleosum]XP_030464079.2 protein PIN-LIKES 3-like isoform X2 [Syzygium oleosum]XP_030464080.2 protein PIN-LIKES 3-like isoform X2 [Syzygium oleosum]XP_056176266.1 protein PIN-LIKES 3-like isoform X2 [Syzygium oleosum]